MPALPPNFRLIAIIVAGSFNLLGALWILADARARRAQKPLFAAAAMLTLGPLWMAFYMSDRPLRANERRRGGFGFDWTRNFAMAWTASMVPWIAVGLLDPTQVPFLFGMWLAPVIIATAIGTGIRRADAIEVGGPAPAATRIPLTVVSVLAACLTFLLLWRI